MNSYGKMEFISFLRGIAAISVLFCHLLIMFFSGGAGLIAIWPFLGNYANPVISVTNLAQISDRLFLNSGYIGVALFFLTTGFLVVPSVKKYQKAHIFLLAKALRLYPLYIVGFSVTFLVIWIFTHVNNPKVV